ncbi:DUF4245 domain-containing protein [Microbacterium terricola]|uniref:DUF4245 domain-containing protein n=1 Tax=Microbacterium terricola TaxID=344163 RepID=A0ABM8DZQ3_9MICO|nr:DUF4245 domain-containing protein [Microbacterium terricola]UYK41165.1 DUF4245 domain-containing protein [Microbacterium terricola]BDV31065.1 hypothetical protein Microterr_17250 [Microbacterium terricola]
MAGRVVAELGRPETPDETAARKAESSRVYRSSQTARNLVAAILVTVAVVVVIVFAVPRGEPAAREPIDVPAVADQVSSSLGRTVVVPEVPAAWRVNGAALSSAEPEVWTIIYVPDETGYVRVAQGFDADEAWPARVLSGADADDTVTIGGVEWTRYAIPDASRAGNISAALSTPAGPDTIMVYGAAGEDVLEQAAAAVSAQVLELQEDAQ